MISLILESGRKARKTTIATVELDIANQVRHDFRSRITDHQLEDGASVQDHIARDPDRLLIDGIITNTPIVVFGLGLDGADRRFESYEELRALIESAEIITVVTGLDVFPDMALESLEFPVDAKTGAALRMRAEFKRIRKVSSSSVTMEPELIRTVDRDQAAPAQQVGAQTTRPATPAEGEAAEEPIRSLLSRVLDPILPPLK